MEIDWESFKDTYNKWNKTSFKTAKEMIEYLYKNHGKFVGPVSEKLGVSWGAVNSYLKKNNILDKKNRGGNNYVNRPIGKKEQIFLNITEKTMGKLSSSQICERCGLSIGYCKKLIKKHNRSYAKWLRKESI